MTLEESFSKLTIDNPIFTQFFTKLIVSIIILFIGFILGRTSEKIMNKFLHEIELNKISKKVGIKFSLEKLLSKIAKYIIYFVFTILALNQIGLTTTILNMILGAALILIIISILLGIKDFIPNIISGFMIYRKDIIKKGNILTIGELKGKVVNINLLETKIKTKKGDIIHIPNSTITKKEIIIKKS